MFPSGLLPLSSFWRNKPIRMKILAPPGAGGANSFGPGRIEYDGGITTDGGSSAVLPTISCGEKKIEKKRKKRLTFALPSAILAKRLGTEAADF